MTWKAVYFTISYLFVMVKSSNRVKILLSKELSVDVLHYGEAVIYVLG